MKPQVDFIIPCNNQEGEMILNFRNVEEIESVIDSLEECRAELEHQIEMERQRRREKKKRYKMRKRGQEVRVMQLPVKLKNGDSFVVTCHDVVFNPESGTFNYTMNNEVILSIPISAMAEEPDFE